MVGRSEGGDFYFAFLHPISTLAFLPSASSLFLSPVNDDKEKRLREGKTLGYRRLRDRQMK